MPGTCRLDRRNERHPALFMPVWIHSECRQGHDAYAGHAGGAIRDFVPETFYTVQLQSDGLKASGRKYKDRSEAEELAERCRSEGQMSVTKVVTKDKSEKPPLLYDLTSLQRDANKILGYSAQQTLDYLQSLYEKKLVTYPRTDSRYLTEDMAAGLPQLAKTATGALEYSGPVSVNAKQVINNSRVSDHHAVIPTKEVSTAKIRELPKGEAEILKLVTVRLLCAVGLPCRYTETTVTITCAGETFSIRGKQILDLGWKAVMNHYYPAKEKEETVPDVKEGQVLAINNTEVKEGKTKPAQHYTEGSKDKTCPALYGRVASSCNGNRRCGRHSGRGRTQRTGHSGNQGRHDREADPEGLCHPLRRQENKDPASDGKGHIPDRCHA